MAEIVHNAVLRFCMQNITKRFGATTALNGLNFSVPAGEVHALIGENGAGKSTLMKILSGALKPDSGSMQINGVAYAPTTPMQARTLGVAMIYQELSLAPHLTVVENIFLGIEKTNRGMLQKKQMHQAAQKALIELEHPEINPNTPIHTLPIALQQIVEIARALVVECQILVLDEPTSSLTRTDAQRLFRVIARLKERGLAIVYISHFLEEVKQIADQFTVLRDGYTVGSGSVSTTPIHDIVQLMVGRHIENLFPKSNHTQYDPILSLSSLSGSPLPKDASLTLHKGEVFGIAGLIGAGRTELLRTLFGLHPIQSGHITFATYTGSASPHQRLQQGMGLLSEDRKMEGLAQTMSVSDNLTLSKLPSFPLTSPKMDEITQRWIKHLRIRVEKPNQPIATLSGGNQQKVALARLLHHDVDLFLLDEPTRGIDIASKADIYHLIDQLAQQGKAILLISSYLPELLGICDRIAVMSRGSLTPARPASQCTEHSLMVEATGQEAT